LLVLRVNRGDVSEETNFADVHKAREYPNELAEPIFSSSHSSSILNIAEKRERERLQIVLVYLSNKRSRNERGTRRPISFGVIDVADFSWSSQAQLKRDLSFVVLAVSLACPLLLVQQPKRERE